MTRMMETRESRQMFSVTAVDPTAPPVDTSAAAEVDVSKAVPKLAEACVKGKVFSRVVLHATATYSEERPAAASWHHGDPTRPTGGSGHRAGCGPHGGTAARLGRLGTRFAQGYETFTPELW